MRPISSATREQIPRHSSSSDTGFTLIEILIVITIVFVIAAVTFVAFGNLQSQKALSRDTAHIVSLLELARSHTLGSKDDSQYGVHWDRSDTFSTFKGTSFSASNVVADETLHPSVRVHSFSVQNSTDKVIFDRLKGTTANHGSIVLVQPAHDTGTTTITVEPTGIVTTHHSP